MDTKQQILTVAQKLAQQRGINGFSYADIAIAVGIRKASLHHHFPAKTDLVLALIAGYTDQAQLELDRIAQSSVTADVKLRLYIELYRQTYHADCICLGGMLASEVQSLDATVLARLKVFFDAQKSWLSELLRVGQSQQIFTLTMIPEMHAQMLLAALQGGLLILRATSDIVAFNQVAELLVLNLMRKS